MKDDTTGDRMLARCTGSVIAILGQAIQDGPGGLMKRAGEVLRDTAGMPFFKALHRQVQAMIDEGTIKPERADSSDTKTALAELVDDLDQSVPDERRLEILRRAFLAVAIGSPDDPGGTMGLVFLRLARKLSGESAVVLGAAYKFRTAADGPGVDTRDGHRWQERAMRETNIPYHEAFREIMIELRNLRLVSANTDGSPAWRRELGALSRLGLGFCEFLERAGPLDAPSSPAAD